ncbi:XRE family transcriptional regulator [Paludibacter sp. 221]|uniref:helix-turn-helix domain-containing protein n=1 Tax=Paludibacter sp. 221 TaxID=2302939 RepID=UPI0013D41F6A|nr:XRE family transcriptional regulator [Paludibacter sp. 221]NDV46690.1 XRE family transcriptional regulator [Paludibacter sp. 221]
MEQNVVGKKIVTLCTDKNIPLEELAERSGLTAAQVDKIINSDRIPSLGSLIKIARALGVRVGTFLDDSEELGPVIQRKDDIQEAATFSSQLSDANSHLDFYSLASQKAGRHMEPFVINIKPSAEHKPILSTHEGEEFIYVLQGAIKVHYGKNQHVLQAGDSIYYDSIVDHLVEALNGETAQILAVVYTPM